MGKTMNKPNRLILRALVWKDVRGQDTVEYALMLGLVAFAACSILPALSTNIIGVFSQLVSEMTGSGQYGASGS